MKGKQEIKYMLMPEFRILGSAKISWIQVNWNTNRVETPSNKLTPTKVKGKIATRCSPISHRKQSLTLACVSIVSYISLFASL